MSLEKFRPLLQPKPEWGPLATFVPNKRLPVYNWLYFKEGFSRSLVFELARLFQLQPGDLVLDPWCGSGTTLLACKELGINSTGLDLLPIALLASHAKTQHYDPEKLRSLSTALFSVPFRNIPSPGPFTRFFDRHLLDDVLLFREEVERLPSPERDFFLLALVSSTIRASWLWKDGTVLKVRKHPVPPFRKFFRNRVLRMIKEYERFPTTVAKALVMEANPANIVLEDETVQAVITSPPYLNQIDYSRVYAVENWLLGHWDGPFTQPSLPAYLGEESESRYFLDMAAILKELFRVCSPGARLGIVIGNAYFPPQDKIVESDLLLASLGEEAGFRPKKILVLNTRAALQHRTIKKGLLRESLLLLEKP